MTRWITLALLLIPLLSHAELPLGDYVLQLPDVEAESGTSYTGEIKKYDVAVTNSITGQLVVVPTSPYPDWAHVILFPSKAPSVDIKEWDRNSEKVPGLLAFADGKKLRLRGLWTQGEAALLFELGGNQTNGSWTGSATVEFPIRAPKKDRLRYHMDWSLTPKGSNAPSLSKEVKYFGPKLKTKAVHVETSTPENTVDK